MAAAYIHPTALVETPDIGAGTRIWAHVHIMAGAVVGPDCNVCDAAFIESGVRIGRGVTVKTGVSICEGITIEDGAFIGPDAVFTNDLRPRSPRLPFMREKYATKRWLEPTRVGRGASIGANATIGPGLVIGEWAMVAAGAVVVRRVAPHVLVVGNPARSIGHVCACAQRLTLDQGRAVCAGCHRAYVVNGGAVTPVHPIETWPDAVP